MLMTKLATAGARFERDFIYALSRRTSHKPESFKLKRPRSLSQKKHQEFGPMTPRLAAWPAGSKALHYVPQPKRSGHFPPAALGAG